MEVYGAMPAPKATRRKKTGQEPLTAGSEAVQALLAAIVESSQDAIISKTLDGRIVSWNRAAERLYGYTPEEVIGQPVSILAPPERLDDMPRILDAIKRGERVEHFETERIRKDGTRLYVSLSVSPIKDSSGRIIGASKIARDITDRIRAEQEMAKAKAAAEAASRAKDDFLAALSHELRTPLTPILIVSQLLKEDASLPESVRADMRLIHRNVSLEARLIDDLLDLTRVARGKMQLKPEAVNVHELLEHALETCCDEAFREKSLKVDCELRAANSQVWGDPARLEQVFWNLISNAVKFTPPGGRITIRTGNHGPDSLCVEVIDTGAGIEPENLVCVFNAFEQGGVETTRKFGGLGLGLAISKAIVGLHNGRIVARSEGPGKGAAFSVDLPTAAVQQVQASSALAQASASVAREHVHPNGCRILLVEDHSPTAIVLKRLIKRWGWDVDWAANAKTALEHASKGPFDLVISDLGLPDASGHDLMQQLHKLHGLHGIALSGYGMEQDVQRSIASGFEKHLTKPVDFDELRSAIDAVLAPRSCVDETATVPT